MFSLRSSNALIKKVNCLDVQRKPKKKYPLDRRMNKKSEQCISAHTDFQIHFVYFPFISVLFPHTFIFSPFNSILIPHVRNSLIVCNWVFDSTLLFSQNKTFICERLIVFCPTVLYGYIDLLDRMVKRATIIDLIWKNVPRLVFRLGLHWSFSLQFWPI